MREFVRIPSFKAGKPNSKSRPNQDWHSGQFGAALLTGEAASSDAAFRATRLVAQQVQPFRPLLKRASCQQSRCGSREDERASPLAALSWRYAIAKR